MAYRDDQEGTKLRIAELEGELAAAQDTIARLKGHVDDSASDAMADMLTKEKLLVVRELDFAIDEDGLEAIAEMLRQRLPKCQVAQVGRTLSCRWNTAELQLSRHDDRTELRLSAHDPRQKALLALGGFGFAVLGGPIIGGLVAAITGSAVAIAAAAPLILIGGYLLMDKLTRWNLKVARTTLRGAFEAAIEIAKDHEQQPPARIEVSATAEAEREAAAEAEAAAAEAEAAAEDVRRQRIERP